MTITGHDPEKWVRLFRRVSRSCLERMPVRRCASEVYRPPAGPWGS
jgi:hypothetical protein